MALKLPEFLDLIFDYCDNNDIQYCFARHYQDLPNEKKDGDLDLIITPDRLQDVIKFIRAQSDLSIVNLVRRSDAVNLFIAGVEWGDGFKAIQLDLFFNLSWKGIPFLPVENVLLRAHTLGQRNKRIKVPDPVDEMIITFFSTMMNAGVVKDRYWQEWVKITRKKPQTVRDKIRRRMGSFYAHALADCFDRDDQQSVLKSKNRWRYGFLSKQWRHEGLHLIPWIWNHICCEIKIILQSRKTTRLAFFGPDGSGKTTVIFALKDTLNHMSKGISLRHVRPILLYDHVEDEKSVLDNPQGKPLRSVFMSNVKLLYFLMIYWIDGLKLRRVPEIIIYDRYFHDMAVDPKRYRFGGSQKLLSFILKLVPKPDLAVLVDITPEVAQARKQEVPLEETKRQVLAYREMVQKSFKNHLIISGEQDVTKSVSEVYTRFVSTLKDKNDSGQ